MTFEGLAGALKNLFKGGTGLSLSDEDFNDLALRVFHFQCRANPAYAGFVSRRGIRARSLTRWEGIPFLPARAFKSTALLSGPQGGVEVIFRTSGTTRGRGERGEHHVRDLSLYRGSLLPNFQAHLLPDEPGRIRILCLLPSPDTAPDSSLSFMMGEGIRAFGDGGSGFFVDGAGRVEGERFESSLRRVEGEGVPVLLAGTAFAFVGWMEMREKRAPGVALPRGSRIMETGGYKGRSRELPRRELYRSLREAFGIEEAWIVNEYGMTELLSQFYEPVLAEASVEEGKGKVGRGRHGKEGGRETGRVEGRSLEVGGTGSVPEEPGSKLEERYHRGPPWVRTLVLDPLTLEPLPSGEVGVLAHMDLANLGSVSAILTEDLGRGMKDGFQLLGRSPGSEPRGCSLAMEDFLASQEEKGPEGGNR